MRHLLYNNLRLYCLDIKIGAKTGRFLYHKKLISALYLIRQGIYNKVKLIYYSVYYLYMESLLFNNPMNLKIIDREIPKPGADEVVIKTSYCGICGSDKHAYNGKHPRIQYPIIPGHEFSGVISKLGDKVRGFATGDRVVIDPNIACNKCYYCLSGKRHFCENKSPIGPAPSTSALDPGDRPISSIACKTHAIGSVKAASFIETLFGTLYKFDAGTATYCEYAPSTFIPMLFKFSQKWRFPDRQ